MQYCPEVRSQRQHGTCTSWATVYAARTIAEAVKYGWTDKKKVTNEAFSPIFVYAQTKGKSDKDCQRGIYINDALEFMKNKGVAKFLSFPELCANFVNNDLKAEATHFKINGYFTLFSLECKNSAIKISKVKKSLCEDRPVVIAMWLPQSFFEAYNNNNQPKRRPDHRQGCGHQRNGHGVPDPVGRGNPGDLGQRGLFPGGEQMDQRGRDLCVLGL